MAAGNTNRYGSNVSAELIAKLAMVAAKESGEEARRWKRRKGRG